MSSTYAGNPASYPDEVTIPDDSDPPTAAAFNPALEGLADRTAYLHTQVTVVESHSFTSSGSVVVPVGATHAIFQGSGAGGGGGGAYISSGSGKSDSAGAGGGGAVERMGLIPLADLGIADGETLNVNVGAGGSAGNGGSSASSGGPGGDTTIVRASDSSVLARMRGANGGLRGSSDNLNADSSTVIFSDIDPSGTAIYIVSSGGAPVRNTLAGSWPRTLETVPGSSLTPQAGGNGYSRAKSGDNGRPSPQGFDGGVGGTNGTTDLLCYGGAGGGAGGAGPYGAGANGGHGGNANSASDPDPGLAGASAAANSGAGGGGGGAAGATTAGTPQDGGAGGVGGSGRVSIVFIRKAGS